MRDARTIIAQALWPDEPVAAALEYWGDDADAILAALDAAGLAVVPKMPSEEMITAAREQLHQDDEWFTPDRFQVEAALKHAIAAAKEPRT